MLSYNKTYKPLVIQIVPKEVGWDNSVLRILYKFLYLYSSWNKSRVSRKKKKKSAWLHSLHILPSRSPERSPKLNLDLGLFHTAGRVAWHSIWVPQA